MESLASMVRLCELIINSNIKNSNAKKSNVKNSNVKNIKNCSFVLKANWSLVYGHKNIRL